MQPISADSHVVEGPEVFAGLADRFGDDAPRVVSSDGKGDHIVIPAHKSRTVNVGMMALAATHDVDPPVERLGLGEDDATRERRAPLPPAIHQRHVCGRRRVAAHDVDGAV